MRDKVIVGSLVVIAAWLWCRGGEPAERSQLAASSPVPDAPRAARELGWRDALPVGPLRLEGRVVDEGGRGVGGAVVTLAIEPPRTAVTDADGLFGFEQLVPGAYTLIAAAGDRIAGPTPSWLRDRREPLRLRLRASSIVPVKIVDGGAPVAGAVPHLTAEVSARGFAVDDRGLVRRVAQSEPDYGMAFELAAPGYAPEPVLTWQLDQPTGSVVKLRTGVPVSGRVTDPSGRPLAGVQITPLRDGYLPLETAAAVTDAHGRYTTGPLAPARYAMRVVDGEHARVRLPDLTVETTARSLDVVLQPGAVVTGVIVDQAHHPVAYAAAVITADDGWGYGGRRAIADRDGRFEIRGLVAGIATIRGTSPDGRGKPLRISPVAGARIDVELVLDFAGTIAGVVVDQRGAPTADAVVRAILRRRGSEPELFAISDAAGRFVVRGLEPEIYQLTAEPWPGYHATPASAVRARPGSGDVRISPRPDAR